MFKNVSENINLGFCSFCGACIAVCPFKNLEYDYSTPSNPHVGPSTYCDKCRLTLCMQVCPQLRIPDELYNLEKYKFIEIYEARSKDTEILKRAQDGGATTSLLIAGLRTGIIDSVIAVKRDDMWHPVPILTSNEDEVLEAAGTKYLYAPSLLKLREAVLRKDINSIALVGVPCQVRALEKMKKQGLRHADKVKLRIALFCTHNFTRERMQEIINELKLDFKDIVKMDIKAKLVFTTKDGKSYTYPLSKALKNLRPACMQCPEFISPYADINIGSIGSPKGWNTVIVISDKGKEILEEAVKKNLLELKPISEKGIKLVLKFIERKVKEGEKHFKEYIEKYHELLRGSYLKK